MNVSEYRIVVYSANFGSHDSMTPPKAQGVPAEWFMFTDDPSGVPDPWIPISVDQKFVNPRDLARFVKFQPESSFDFDESKMLMIWLDGSIEVVADDFISGILSEFEEGKLLVFSNTACRSGLEEYLSLLSKGALNASDAYESVRRAKESDVSLFDPVVATGCMVYAFSSSRVSELRSEVVNRLPLCGMRDQVALFELSATHSDDLKILDISIYRQQMSLKRRFFSRFIFLVVIWHISRSSVPSGLVSFLRYAVDWRDFLSFFTQSRRPAGLLRPNTWFQVRSHSSG